MSAPDVGQYHQLETERDGAVPIVPLSDGASRDMPSSGMRFSSRDVVREGVVGRAVLQRPAAGRAEARRRVGGSP